MLISMKFDLKTLFRSPWITVKEVKTDKFSYTYVSGDSDDKVFITIMPFRRVNGKLEFLSRYELRPCWSLDSLKMTCVTGAMQENKTPAETAQAELQEETGYVCELDEIIPLGQSHVSKSSDSRCEFFTVDLTDKEPGEIHGDGSYLETLSKNHWTNQSTLIKKSEDCLTSAALLKTLSYLQSK